MKKMTVFVGIVALAMSFVACNSGEEERAKSQKTIDSLQAIVDGQEEEVSSLFEVLNEIEDNLATVTSKFGNVEQLKRSQVEGRSDVKLQINDQISQINEMMTANKEKLDQLNLKVQTSHKENVKLQEFVEKLQTRINEQETEIQNLLTELEQKKIVIEGLNNDVRTLTETNAKKDQVIETQTNEANKVYYIVGTYTELKELGVLTKTGGFIGIGRKQQVTADANAQQVFRQVDKRSVTSIAVNAKGVQVVSKHPEGSYELVMSEDGKTCTSLKIKNVSEFWRYTNYLVISTK